MKTYSRRGRAGFSMIELLVTIIIAGIAFAAMVPLFVQAQQQTSADQVRNVALNIAQQKVELIRQLDWAELVEDEADPTTLPNLYNPEFKRDTVTGKSPFGPTWTSDTGRTFTIAYDVVDVPEPSGSGQIAYKDVTVTVEWTAPPSPVKPVQLQTRVYRQSAGSRVTALTADPLYTDATLTSVVGVEKYIGGQVTLTATTASASDFVTFFVYNGDGSLVAPAVQDIYHRGGTAFTCTWNPTIGYDGLYYISAVATTGGYPGNTLQASYYVETGPPLPPTELLPQVGDGRVILSWTRPKANDVSHYIVYRSDGTGAETPVTTSDGQPTQAEVFVDASVTNGVTYTYRVSAVDILGKESAKSDPVTATPATPGDLTDPTPPGSFSASVAGPSVVLSWELSTDNVAVLGYMVYRDKDLAAPIARVSAGATSFIDTNAGYSQTHTYTVKAYDTSLRFSALATLANPLPAGQQNVDGWLQVGTDQQAYYTLLVSTNKPNVTMSAISQDTGKLYTPSVASGANKPAQFNNLPAGSYWVTGIYNSKAGEQRATIAVHLTADNQEATIIFN